MISYVINYVSQLTISLYRHLFNQEGGFKVFFRGITPALIGAIPTRAIMLASYPSYKNLCDKIPHLRSNMNATHFTSGALASK